MPQKKAKKAKLEKPKKLGKPAPKVASGSVLKKAAKAVVKKVGAALSNGKKKAAAPKKALPAKPLKLAGKLEKTAPAKMVLKKKGAEKAPSAKGLSKEKKVKDHSLKAKAQVKEVTALPAAKLVGKKKGELVVEVPAPKGVALLGREGKKKSRSSESSASHKKRCREPGCEHELLLGGYCRLHYIKNWRKIKRKEAILASGQLNNYVEELVSKYPDKYLDVIRQDLASEKDWVKVVVDLELESSDEEGSGDEDLEGVAEGVRREREFDDDSDSF